MPSPAILSPGCPLPVTWPGIPGHMAARPSALAPYWRRGTVISTTIRNVEWNIQKSRNAATKIAKGAVRHTEWGEIRGLERWGMHTDTKSPSPRHWACALGYGLGLYECRQHHLQGPGRALGWETGLGDHSKSHPSSIFQNSLVCRYVQSFLKHSRSLLFCKHLK